MLSRLTLLSKLFTSQDAREDYLRAKLNQIIPSQIRALRMREKWTQQDFAKRAGMKQARISAMERPGQVNFSLETLVRVAASFKVALQVRFVPYSRMLDWENNYNQESFSPVRIEDDLAFRDPDLLLGQNLIETLSTKVENIASQSSREKSFGFASARAMRQEAAQAAEGVPYEVARAS